MIRVVNLTSQILFPSLIKLQIVHSIKLLIFPFNNKLNNLVLIKVHINLPKPIILRELGRLFERKKPKKALVDFWKGFQKLVVHFSQTINFSILYGENDLLLSSVYIYFKIKNVSFVNSNQLPKIIKFEFILYILLMQINKNRDLITL